MFSVNEFDDDHTATLKHQGLSSEPFLVRLMSKGIVVFASLACSQMK